MSGGGGELVSGCGRIGEGGKGGFGTGRGTIGTEGEDGGVS